MAAPVGVIDCEVYDLSDYTIGLITDVGQINDKSFNQSSWEGVLAAEAGGANVYYIDTQNSADYANNIAEFAEQGYDIIVTVGFALGNATLEAAATYPDVTFIGVDQFQAETVENVVGLVFNEDQSGFLAGALAAVKLGIRVAHVEAGLRSFNRAMPEEHNRVLTDHCADLLFCPTQTAVDLLAAEGVTQGVHLVGDVMFDAARQFAEVATARSTIVARLGLAPRGYALATLHRPYNTDDPARLRLVLDALNRLELPVVFPVHPRTRARLAEMGTAECAGQTATGLRCVEPVGYLDMVMLERHARLIVTDSGGVQKEAFFYQVPCVTLRQETEWVELVELGWNRLAPPVNTPLLVNTVTDALTSLPKRGENPYGDGRSAERIVRILMERIGR